MSKVFARTAVFGILMVYSASANAQDAEVAGAPGFGGPNAVENQMAEDRESWNDWKKSLEEDHGFAFSIDYTGVLLTASETFSNDSAAGGIARIYGAWDLVDEGAGALVWKFEHRHAYGNTSPFDFSLGQIGYVGLQEPPIQRLRFQDTEPVLAA